MRPSRKPREATTQTGQTRLGIRTINVQHKLDLQLQRLLSQAAADDIGVLVVQEPGVSLANRAAIRAGARNAGFNTFFSEPCGNIILVIIFTARPTAAFTPPATCKLVFGSHDLYSYKYFVRACGRCFWWVYIYTRTT